MGMFETKKEVAEAKSAGWLTDDGKLTQAGADRMRFETGVVHGANAAGATVDPREVGR